MIPELLDFEGKYGGMPVINKSKNKLDIRILEEFIDAKIDMRTLPIRPNLNQEMVEERMNKARKKLIEYLEENK